MAKIISNFELLHKLMTNSSDIVAIIDKDFIIRYESPSLTKILGYKVKELVGQNALIFCHPDDTQRIAQSVSKLIQNPLIPQTVRYRFLHKNGTWKILESIGKNFLNDSSIQGIVINTKDVTERVKREEEKDFLIEATTILNSSLNYKETLVTIAKLTVPKFADWCVVHVVEDDNTPQIVALHIEQEKIKLANELRKKYPPDPNADFGVSKVFRTGKPELTTRLEDYVLKESAKDEEHYQMLRELGVKSCLYVPIKLRKKILGVITLVSSDERNLYTKRDQDFIQEVADRTAVAIENARLYKLAQSEIKKTKKAEAYAHELNATLEETVKKRTAQLQRANEVLQQEITERMQAQEILTKSEQRLALHIKRTPLGVIEWDSDLTIREWNPAATRIFGYKKSEAVEKSISDLLILKDHKSLTEKDLKNIITNRKGNKGTYYNITKEGRNIVCEWYNTPLINSSDEIIGMTSLILDITDQKSAQTALENLATELNRSNKELQDFASVASHDLQEPLRKIQAFGDRLNLKYADILGDEGKDYLNRMLNASKRMQILINDLLTFARVTTRAQPFRKISLDKILREVLSDLETRIESSNATIESVKLPNIEADPLQIRQLFQNILSNGLKFQREDIQPHIKVYTRDTNILDELTIGDGVSKKAIEIIMEDNGIGFDEKYLDKIFNVFQRLHNQNDYSGTGVGLAVCRKIVERHNGSITATSRLGKGSSFIITLPIKQR